MGKKIDDFMRGRTEGMEFALKIAKEKGIDALEKEVRFRNRTGISLNVTTEEMNAASKKIKEMARDTILVLSLASLHDVFGFKKVRLQRFMDKFDEGADYLLEDFATWQDYLDAIKDQTGIELDIRYNN